MNTRHLVGATLVTTLLLVGCGSDEPSADSADTQSTTALVSTTSLASPSSTAVDSTALDFPTIVGATATAMGDSWRFDVTISSPYDSPTQYADAWRVLGPDGTEYGIRILAHDHAGEQPFTRSQSGIVIPADVTTVVIAARDLVNGWSEDTYELVLP